MLMRMIRRLVKFWRVVWWFIVSSYRVNRGNRRTGWEAIAYAAEHTRLWAQGAAKIINFELVVHGDPEKFPGGLVVSNHQGYLDIVAHASIFPIRFAPKAEMRFWPLLGRFVGLNRPIWIDRKSRQKSREVAAEMIETLRHHINLLVYPEGTSTDGKHGMLPFKSTPFEAAVDSGCKIQPVLTFFSSDCPHAEPLAWFGETPLLPHIWRIVGLAHLRADIYVLDVMEPMPGENRKELAARVYELMNREYGRIANHDEV